jgi:hypothetical protein
MSISRMPVCRIVGKKVVERRESEGEAVAYLRLKSLFHSCQAGSRRNKKEAAFLSDYEHAGSRIWVFRLLHSPFLSKKKPQESCRTAGWEFTSVDSISILEDALLQKTLRA